MRNFFYGMLTMLLLVAVAAKAQSVFSDHLTIPIEPKNAQGILALAVTPSDKSVAIQADETGHVICAEPKP